MIQKEWMELIKKYSYIEDAKIKGADIIITYTKDGKQKQKKLPLRVSGAQIQKTIQNIKKELGIKYVEQRHGNFYIVSG